MVRMIFVKKGSKSQLLEFIQAGATSLQGQVSYHDDQDRPPKELLLMSMLKVYYAYYG